MARKDGAAGPFARIAQRFGGGRRKAEAARQQAEAEAAAERERAKAAEASAQAAAAQPQTLNIADFVAEINATRSTGATTSAHSEPNTTTAAAPEAVIDEPASYTIGTVFKSTYEVAGELAAIGRPNGILARSAGVGTAVGTGAGTGAGVGTGTAAGVGTAAGNGASTGNGTGTANGSAANADWPTDGVVSIADLFASGSPTGTGN